MFIYCKHPHLSFSFSLAMTVLLSRLLTIKTPREEEAEDEAEEAIQHPNLTIPQSKRQVSAVKKNSERLCPYRILKKLYFSNKSHFILNLDVPFHVHMCLSLSNSL